METGIILGVPCLERCGSPPIRECGFSIRVLYPTLTGTYNAKRTLETVNIDRFSSKAWFCGARRSRNYLLALLLLRLLLFQLFQFLFHHHLLLLLG
jgi:hypothetical protein